MPTFRTSTARSTGAAKTPLRSSAELCGRERSKLTSCSARRRRARQTATLVKESAGLSAELLYDERIYEADAARLLEVVSQAAEPADALMLVGHNPGMEELLTFLTGEERRMPTAALACVALDVEKWGKVRARAGRLEWLVRPKELAED